MVSPRKSQDLPRTSSLVGVNIPIHHEAFGCKNFPSVYCFTLVSSEKPWDQEKSLREFSDHYPFTLFSGGVNHIKENVQLYTGRSKLLWEPKFHDDEYLWKENITHLGYFLVNFCLLFSGPYPLSPLRVAMPLSFVFKSLWFSSISWFSQFYRPKWHIVAY